MDKYQRWRNSPGILYPEEAIVFLRQHLRIKGSLLVTSKDSELRRTHLQLYLLIPCLLQIVHADIVFVIKDKEITIIELTVPFNSPDCINAAQEYKVSKYQLLLSDLEAKGYTSRFVAIEIGALGHYLNRTCESLSRAFPFIPKAAIRNLLDEAG